MLLDGKITAGQQVTVDVQDDRLAFSVGERQTRTMQSKEGSDRT
jgi:hypothetical protein